MKRCVMWFVGAIALACIVSIVVDPLAAQTKALATNGPVIPREAVPDFFKNPPGIYTGEDMGIATSSAGSIYIYRAKFPIEELSSLT